MSPIGKTSVGLRKSLVLGQVCSILITITGICSKLVGESQVPALQAGLGYLGIALVFGGMVLYRRKKLKNSIPTYIAITFLDFQANFLAVWAYSYTNLTSAVLLAAATDPLVMIFSRIILKVRYSWMHYAGVITCLSGVLALTLFDAGKLGAGGPVSHILLGDLMVLGSAATYALGNVLQERALQDTDSTELLGMIGMIGVPIAFIQALLLEHSKIASLTLTATTSGLLFAYSTALLVFYTLATNILLLSSSLVLNLSLITANLWSMVADFLFFKEMSHQDLPKFLLALVLVVIGLAIYAYADVTNKSSGAAVGEGEGDVEEGAEGGEDGERERLTAAVDGIVGGGRGGSFDSISAVELSVSVSGGGGDLGKALEGGQRLGHEEGGGKEAGGDDAQRPPNLERTEALGRGRSEVRGQIQLGSRIGGLDGGWQQWHSGRGGGGATVQSLGGGGEVGRGRWKEPRRLGCVSGVGCGVSTTKYAQNSFVNMRRVPCMDTRGKCGLQTRFGVQKGGVMMLSCF